MKLLFSNLLLVSAAIISITGDILSKTWTLNQKVLFFVLALVAYTATSVIWLFFLKDLRLSVAIPWWQGMVAVPAILAGIIYFRERLSWLEVLAIILILTGIIILNLRHV